MRVDIRFDDRKSVSSIERSTLPQPTHSASSCFDGFAARGKASMGWFYGFKLHLVDNRAGEIIAVVLTPGNVDDRASLDRLMQRFR